MLLVLLTAVEETVPQVNVHHVLVEPLKTCKTSLHGAESTLGTKLAVNASFLMKVEETLMLQTTTLTDQQMLDYGKLIASIGVDVVEEKHHVTQLKISTALLKFIKEVEIVGSHGLPTLPVDADSHLKSIH